jgi:UDP-2,3-diacylglucosamine hydrolase
VLGDLVDYWVGRPQQRASGWRELLAPLARAAERAVRIYVCWGNRDFQLDGTFEQATGVRVVGGGLRLRHGGVRDLVCLHGDELCQNDQRYQRAKRRLRNPALRWFLHHAPFLVSRHLAGEARRRSRESTGSADPVTLAPSRAAMASVRRLGSLDLLFGHIHTAGRGALPGAADDLRFHVLPAFEPDGRGHVRWTPGEDLRLQWEGRRIPWPGEVRLGP